MRTTSPTAAALLSALLTFGGASLGAPTPDETFRALAAQIKRGVDGVGATDADIIPALRQLRDPRLRPLFAHLATAGRGEQQVQAALGLAELDEPARLDTFLVAQIKTPEALARLLGAAHAQGLLGAEQIDALLSRPDLPGPVEARLALLSAAVGTPIDGARAKRLASDASAVVARVGAILLAQSGDEAGARPALERVADGSPEMRQGLLATLEDIRTAKATALGAYVRGIGAGARDDHLIRADAAATLLALGDTSGPGAWAEALAGARDLADRLRLAMVALWNAERFAPGAFAGLPGSETSAALLAMSTACERVATKSLDLTTLMGLIETDHPPCVTWALERAGSLGSADATRARLASVERLGAIEKPPRALSQCVVAAAAALADESPTEYSLAYTKAVWSGSEAVAQAMLLGALAAKEGRVVAGIATQEPPGDEAKALRAILIARSAETLTPDQQVALEQAADGRGGLSDARRTQAAWLALRHQGQDRKALAVVLTPAE